MAARISVHIHAALGGLADEIPPAEWIARAADCALSAAAEPDRAESESAAALSVALADDETVAALNETHRGVAGTTDVLSFSNVHFGEYYGADARPPPPDPAEFVLPPDCEPDDIGELVISYPQTLRQAAESGRDARDELAALLAHGALHLLGYDHEDERDAALMRQRERDARAAQRRAGLFD